MYEIAISYTILVSLENYTCWEKKQQTLQVRKIRRGWQVD